MTYRRLPLKIAILMLGFALLLAACQTAAQGGQAPAGAPTLMADLSLPYSLLSAEKLSLMLGNKNFTLVSVADPPENELPQTDLVIPYNQLAANLSKLPADKNTPLVLYCATGVYSKMAAQDLLKQGYSNISILAGGMAAWQQAGQPFAK